MADGRRFRNAFVQEPPVPEVADPAPYHCPIRRLNFEEPLQQDGPQIHDNSGPNADHERTYRECCRLIHYWTPLEAYSSHGSRNLMARAHAEHWKPRMIA